MPSVGKSFDFEIEERQAGESIVSDNAIISRMFTVFVPKKQSHDVSVCSIPLFLEETTLLRKQSITSAQTKSVGKHNERSVSVLLGFI